MSTLLIVASSAMVVALILYSIGVFGEKISGTIQFKHLVFFVGGLIFDTIGTTLMNRIARQDGGSTFGLHQITGGAALVLMAFHLVWAIWVYNKGGEKAKHQFHKFSLGVWTLWVISFVLGILLGIGVI
ncbi:TIGR03987 family protein [Sporosarcina sp. P16a]|uniref:HsmA family protein n=1 Tax=unclassified Sporosarcina TaxID=2647733 RepID=UPI000C17292C|nr:MULTISPECIES: HsmA family protein [unclassified Sporosarcina]PIC67997.1 TIGR03987 family protein [Sporosarcina sp. P16a]PIC94306.1 TIGR03987 family protein [Sporosarcina sp. P25]